MPSCRASFALFLTCTLAASAAVAAQTAAANPPPALTTDPLRVGLTGLVAGIVSALFTTLLLRDRIRQELAAEYDRDLRKLRIGSYAKLYAHFVPIARYSRDAGTTYQQLHDISIQTRDWFFGEGGLYLSDTSRPMYFKFKKLLDETLANVALEDLSKTVPADRLTAIVESGSLVRGALAADVGTRKAPLLGTDG